MLKKYLTILVLTFFCGSCTNNPSSTSFSNPVSLVVLFNTDNFSRTELALYIDKINAYQPRTIAINAQLDSLSNVDGDSLLSNAILKSGKVILSASINNSTFEIQKSHPFFRRGVIDEGVLSYIIDDDNTVSEYIPLFENDTEQAVSFPTAIVLSLAQNEDFFRSLRVNQRNKVVLNKNLEDYNVLDKGNFDGNLIKDKIVIFGYLDPDDELLKAKIKNKLVDVNSTVVIANIVESLIRENDIK